MYKKSTFYKSVQRVKLGLAGNNANHSINYTFFFHLFCTDAKKLYFYYDLFVYIQYH